MRPIALVGARGAGKTAVGRHLARLLDRPFADVDGAIAKEAERGWAGEVLDELGEVAFRERELAALTRILDGPAGVVATGGGCVEVPQARALLAERCRCVWLRAPVEVLAARIAADPAPRPALGGVDAILELDEVLRRREPNYAAIAAVAIDAVASSPLEVARAVRDALGKSRD